MNLTTTDSQATGFPLVIATQTQQPTARLQLRNSHGQIIQQWLVKSNKCTLGSAVSCSLRCELPGVAPYHALLVIGARQIFIRALAPKLTRDGQPFNELLLTNDDSHFEIAGHRFELSRANANTEVEPMARAEASSPQRIKFTLARPFELRKRAQAPPITHVNAVQQAAEMISDSRSNGDSKWVAQMIQAAMQPLECQLHNLAEPLNELQRESRNQRRLRKRRAIRKRKAAAELTAIASENSLPETHTQPAEQAQLSEQVEAIAVKHSATMEALTERISQVNQQLQAIERIVVEQRHSLPETHVEPAEQAQLSEQVEAIAVKHSAAMEALTERISQVNQQLQTIERIVVEQRQANQSTDEPQAVPDSPQLTLQTAAIEQLQQSVASMASTLERLQAEQVTERQSAAIEQLQQSVASVSSTLERQQAEQVTERQSAAIEQLQQSVASVSSTLERLRAEQVIEREDDQQWRDDLQSQLGNLTQVIDGLSASVTEVHHVALRAASQPVADTQPDYWAQPTVDSQPVSNWQPDASTQADADDLTPPDSVLVSLPSTPEAWGLATDELDQPAIDREQPVWSAIEPDDAVAESPSDISADISADNDAEVEASHGAGSALQPELAQPAIDREQPVWSAIEPADAVAGQSTETEASGDIAQPDSTSLPSWWADDESDRELQTKLANECFADPDDGQIAELDVQSAGDTDERFVESVGDIDERVYESVSDCDDRISESVHAPKRQSTGEATSDAGHSSEEFFGLAQLDLEEHLREAEPLPLAPMASGRETDASADELFFEEPTASPLAIENQTIDALDAQAIEEQLIGFAQSDDSQAEVALSQPRGDESVVENSAESAIGNAAESGVENSAESVVENAAESDETDSIEEYMRKLLARMRGVPEEEVELSQQAVNKPAGTSTHSHAPTTTASAGDGVGEPTAAELPTANHASRTATDGIDITEPFDPEKYMPRALAPERSNSLAAMRELANSSARTAIHNSTRQRHVSSIALKSVIACVGLVVGMVLLAINGLSLNIGLVATVASFLVAAIWGYDSISSIRPMLQNGLILQPQANPTPPPTDEQD